MLPSILWRVLTKIFHPHEVLQALEVLPVAPPPEPRPLTAEEVKQLEEQEEDTFRELRIFLRNVTHRLAIDKRFRVFTKPVDPDEVLLISSLDEICVSHNDLKKKVESLNSSCRYSALL